MAVEEPSIICDRAISGAVLPLPRNVAPGCGHAATHRTCDWRSPAGQPHRLARQPSLTSGEGRGDGVPVRLPRRGARSGEGSCERLALASDFGVQVNLSSVSPERI